MIIMGMTAAANMAVRPRTLYQAAIQLKVRAVIRVRLVSENNFGNLSIIIFSYR